MSYYDVVGKRQGKIGKSQSQEESSDEHHGSFPSSSAHSHQSLRYVFSLAAFGKHALLGPLRSIIKACCQPLYFCLFKILLVK